MAAGRVTRGHVAGPPYAHRMTGTTPPSPPDPKATLHRYLRVQRDHLLAKLDGLSERDLRWPMTPTGTNLLGLVKHVASVQLGYLGDVFGRPSGRALPWFDDDAEVNADMWATADETSEEIVELFRFSCAHADATVEALDLDTTRTVPWWPPHRQRVTLHSILVHLIVETARHAGHADIIRELLDGSAGNGDGNLPPQRADEWSVYRSRLERAAEKAARAAKKSETPS
jgi:uncharacterized damage-inducible protein DinB